MSPAENPRTGLELPARARALLDAFIAISTDLDIHTVLDRIVASACELTDAAYGALGVVGSDGELIDFITRGLTPERHARIGALPRGRGLLRELIQHPQPLRLEHLQDHPNSFGFPAHHPSMTSFLGVPVRIRGTVFGNLYLTEKANGAAFSEQDELLIQALATAAGFVIENARAFALSERRRRWLEASVRISETLQPPVQLAPALEQIAITARTMTNADAVAVLQREDSDVYTVTAADGAHVVEAAALVDRLQDAILQCEQHGEELTLNQVDERVAVLVPLRAHLAASGVLLVLPEGGRGVLDPEERELLTSFADQASLALDRAAAVADREQLAVVTDRDRIARDLHDVVIQQLFATGLQLQGARRIATDPEVTSRIDQAVQDLDHTISDIRTTIFELRAHTRGSLRAGVHNLVEEYVPVLGFTPNLRTVGPVDNLVPSSLAAHLLASLREAMSNVARHALATTAAVEIHVTEDEVLLRVVDDGTGIPEDRRESGLLNVRRRAHELGGTVWLRPSEPHGTTMEWRVPLPRDN